MSLEYTMTGTVCQAALASLIVIAVAVFSYPVMIRAQDSTSVIDRRAQLESDLAGLEQEIEFQRKELDKRKTERVSLERDIAILNGEIKKSQLSIRARTLAIEKLNSEVAEKEKLIGKLSAKIDREKESLSELLRQTHVLDSSSFIEVILANQNLSDFFIDFDSFDRIHGALRESYTAIEGDRKDTEEARDALEEKRIEETELRTIQQLQKKRIEQQEAEKKTILTQTRGVESVYQNIIRASEKSAAAIRTELFTLRGSAAIPFERALLLANNVQAKTGVRAAFILGVIAEESNLGENVGTGNWKFDMKSPRDTEPFLDITRRLGFDPDKMPVSRKPSYGWGGAMGPAQFIPSTWVLYEAKIAEATGHSPPNPWDPGDAFMASGILLGESGANKGGRSGERLAALRYFAGWANALKPAYSFYGDDVMVLADKYQKQIDILAGS